MFLFILINTIISVLENHESCLINFVSITASIFVFYFKMFEYLLIKYCLAFLKQLKLIRNYATF